MIQRRYTVLLLTLMLGTAACSHTGKGGEDTSPAPSAQGDLEIMVHNNLIPPGPVYVYLVPSAGIERDLGTVYGGNQVVRYRGLALKGSYQLVARTGSRTIASPVLVLTKVAGLDWDLERNRIQVTRTIE